MDLGYSRVKFGFIYLFLCYTTMVHHQMHTGDAKYMFYIDQILFYYAFIN